jgi:predicted MFS family arabinose efflux permease
VLFAATIATSLPLGPFWGVLAERFSRRAIIMRSWLVLAATLLLAAWAPDLGWLVVSRVLFGLSFGSGAVVASTQALLTPSEHVGRAIATVQAAHPIAGSLGPVFGALIIPHVGISGLFVIDAGLILMSTVILMLLVPEPSAGPRPRSIVGRAVEMARYAWTNRLIRWNFSAQMLARGSTTVIDAYLPVRITQLAADPASVIGWTLGAYGLLTTLVVWAGGALVDRGHGLRAFTIGMLFGAAAALGLALAPWLGLVGVLAVPSFTSGRGSFCCARGRPTSRPAGSTKPPARPERHWRSPTSSGCGHSSPTVTSVSASCTRTRASPSRCRSTSPSPRPCTARWR